MNKTQVLKQLKSLGTEQNRKIYARHGVKNELFGVSFANLGKLKKEIKRIVHPDGLVLSFGWNSGGIGKTNGFEMLEILLVNHGGPHNDTICVAERKL